MTADNPELEDDLRAEYDLTRLRIRRLGAARKGFGGTVTQQLNAVYAEEDSHLASALAQLQTRTLSEDNDDINP
ncbi:hypothetical protein V0288_10220 [Pannus brasiliensis CCIBt3594]|uniref:Uncharacterized protein n=1 Tax=Pannus brasiliensis CCIBt3594 TaxID=1427578 RepID=A0AAW9QQX6_9CHRO